MNGNKIKVLLITFVLVPIFWMNYAKNSFPFIFAFIFTIIAIIVFINTFFINVKKKVVVEEYLMKKERAQAWIEVVSKQPFPVVSFDTLRKLYQIAEMEYPKHDYLVAARNMNDNEINQAVQYEIKRG